MGFRILCLLMIASAAVAQTAVPFVAAQTQADFPQAKFADHLLYVGDGGAVNGFGFEVSGGVLFEYTDVYVGARLCRFDAEGITNPTPGQDLIDRSHDVRGSIQLRRGVVGARVHSCSTYPGTLSAIAGAGLSFGKTRVSGTGTRYSQPDTVAATVSSRINIGGFAEIGLSWGLGEFVDVLTLAKYDRFDTSFDTEIWKGRMEASWITLSLGVVYRLKSGY